MSASAGCAKTCSPRRRRPICFPLSPFSQGWAPTVKLPEGRPRDTNYLNTGRWEISALFCLNLMHVFLEFPLNHKTFVGIGSHLRTVLARA